MQKPVAAAALFWPSIALVFVLAGCTTPSTTLTNPRTGQVVTCGGNVSSSLAGGAIGYSIQKSNDRKCIDEHTKLGFVAAR